MTDLDNPLDYREVVLTLRLPHGLRERLLWIVQISGVDGSNVSTSL